MKDNNPAKFVHSLIIVMGISLIFISASIEDTFVQNLFLSLGCNMAVFTIIFIIFQIFNYKSDSDSDKSESKMKESESTNSTEREQLKDSLASSNVPISNRRSWEQEKK